MRPQTIHRLQSPEYAKAGPLYQAMDCHLAPQAVVAGVLPGAVWTDDPHEPASALVQMGGIASIRPGIAATAFAAMVGITMIAATSFDPRLLWDGQREEK